MFLSRRGRYKAERIALLPGYVSERVTPFMAIADAKRVSGVDTGTGDEGITAAKLLPIDRLSTLCRDGRISSALDAYFAMLRDSMRDTIDVGSARLYGRTLRKSVSGGALSSRQGPVKTKLGLMILPKSQGKSHHGL